MKTGTALSCCLIVLFSLGSIVSMKAQESHDFTPKKEIKVKKHTVLGQYEPTMVVPAEERLELKTNRLATIEKKRGIIDTLDISDRKRRRLLKELYRSPFSYKWDKLIADIEAEDEPEEEH